MEEKRKSSVMEHFARFGLLAAVIPLAACVVTYFVMKSQIEKLNDRLAQLQGQIAYSQMKLDDITKEAEAISQRADAAKTTLNRIISFEPAKLDSILARFSSPQANAFIANESAIDFVNKLSARVGNLETKTTILGEQTAAVYRLAAAMPSPQSFRNHMAMVYAMFRLKSQSENGEVDDYWLTDKGYGVVADVVLNLKNDPAKVGAWGIQYRKDYPASTAPATQP